MKKNFKKITYSLFIIFIFITFVYAKQTLFYNYYNSLIVKDDFHDNLKDYDLYVVGGNDIPFGFNSSGGLYKDSNFLKSGYLNVEEYKIAGGLESFYFTGLDFFTMDRDASSVYYITSTGDFKKSVYSNEHSIRNTEYIQNDVTITGSGKVSDPWMFIERPRSFTLKYDYTGEEIEYIVPYTGKYSFTVNGASGINGGKGGYVYTEIELKAGDALTFIVGGQEGKFGGGSGVNKGGDSSRIIYGTKTLVVAGGGGGGGTSSISLGGSTTNGTGNSTDNGKGGTDIGAGGGTDGQNGSGGGSGNAYSSSTISGCSKYSAGDGYCTNSETSGSCGSNTKYTATIGTCNSNIGSYTATSKNCNSSFKDYTNTITSCSKKLVNYTKKTSYCVDGYEAHTYKCTRSVDHYANSRMTCTKMVEDYTKTTSTCNSTTKYTKKVYKCNSTTKYTKTTKKCNKIGIFYKWGTESSQSGLAFCSTSGSVSTCNSTNYGKSNYVCKPTYTNTWSYTTTDNLSSCSATSSFSCVNAKNGQTYTTCTPNYTNTWGTSTSTVSSCTVGTSFDCLHDKKGQSYVSKCTPNYKYYFNKTITNDPSSHAAGSSFTCNASTIGEYYTFSNVFYNYSIGIVTTHTNTPPSYVSSEDNITCNASNYSDFNSGKYGTCLQSPKLETATTISDTCTVGGPVDELTFCGRTNGSSQRFVKSCTPNYSYTTSTSTSTGNSSCVVNALTCNATNAGKSYITACDKTYKYSFGTSTSTLSSCSTGNSFSCNASNNGKSYISSCTPNYNYTFTDSSRTGLTSCSVGTEFSCGSSTIGSTYIKSCTPTTTNNTCCSKCSQPANNGGGGKNYVSSSSSNTVLKSGKNVGNGSIVIDYKGYGD